MAKVATILGSRPHLVRAASLSPAMRRAKVDHVVFTVGSGQAFDDSLYSELSRTRALEVDASDVEWMRLVITGALFQENPDAVLVGGDAPCTLAGALAAIEAGIPLAHVEAGVRGGDAHGDDALRVQVDRMASWLFCTDDECAEALQREEVTGAVHTVGDLLLDSALGFTKAAHERYPVSDAPYVVVYFRRPENLVSPRIERIVEGLNRIRSRVLLPASLGTRSKLLTTKGKIGDHIRIVHELPYLAACSLVSRARAVVTDSGCMQREAYWHGVPCATLRASTEWHETVTHGGNTLVDDDPSAIETFVRDAAVPERLPRLYGDGRAAERVAKTLAVGLK